MARLCRLGVAGEWHGALMLVCVGRVGHVTLVSLALRREAWILGMRLRLRQGSGACSCG